MVRHSVFEVTVSSPDIGPLPEYDDPDAEQEKEKIKGPAVVRFLEATAGLEFNITFKVHPGFEFGHFDVVRFNTSADGTFLESCSMIKSHYKRSGWSATQNGVETMRQDGTWQLQKFQFSAPGLLQDSESSGELDALRYAESGNLRIVIWKNLQTKKSQPKAKSTAANIFAHEPLSEKALKGRGLDLSTSLGEPGPGSSWTTCRSKKVGSTPLLTVLFKYRSRRGLEWERIVPRPASPLLLYERNPAELTAEELRERLAQVEADYSSLVKIKKEHIDASKTSTSTNVKPEQVDDRNNKRKRSSSDDSGRLKLKKTADTKYLASTIEKMQRDVSAINTVSHINPRKLQKQRTNLLHDLESLSREMFSDGSDAEDDEAGHNPKDHAKALAGVHEVMEISDED